VPGLSCRIIEESVMTYNANEEILQPPDLTIHLATDTPHIEVKGYIDMGESKAHWVKIIIGGLVITCFLPTSNGIEHVLSELKKDVSVKVFGFADYPQSSKISLSPLTMKDSQIRLPVEITAYNADPAQTDSTPTITASGKTVAEDICALSRDIEKEFGLKFGDIIHIEGYGDFLFQDRMNKRIKRGLDIFRWDRKEALEIGRRQGTAIFTPRVVSADSPTDPSTDSPTAPRVSASQMHGTELTERSVLTGQYDKTQRG